jgi:thiosulfate:glutathione sulfurtransferase
MFKYSCRLRLYISLEQVEKIVKAKLKHSEAARNIVLIDVRSTSEVAKTGVIPSAVNIPLPILRDVLAPDSVIDDDEFVSFFGAPRPLKGTTQMVFYCAHGVRSAIACEVADELGFDNAGNFSGSWAQWYNAHGAPAPA